MGASGHDVAKTIWLWQQFSLKPDEVWRRISFFAVPDTPVLRVLVVELINLFVRADIQEVNLQLAGFAEANEFKYNPKVVSRRTRPAAIEITSEFMRAQRRMVGDQIPAV